MSERKKSPHKAEKGFPKKHRKIFRAAVAAGVLAVAGAGVGVAAYEGGLSNIPVLGELVTKPTIIDDYSAYLKGAGYQVKEQGSIKTPQTEINLYNYTKYKVQPQAISALFSYVKKLSDASKPLHFSTVIIWAGNRDCYEKASRYSKKSIFCCSKRSALSANNRPGSCCS